MLCDRYSWNLAAYYLGHSHTEREKHKDEIYHLPILQKTSFCVGSRELGPLSTKTLGTDLYSVMS